MSGPTSPCGCCGCPVRAGSPGALIVVEHHDAPAGSLPDRSLRVFCSRTHLAEWLRHPCHGPAGVVQLGPAPPRPPLRLVPDE